MFYLVLINLFKKIQHLHFHYINANLKIRDLTTTRSGLSTKVVYNMLHLKMQFLLGLWGKMDSSCASCHVFLMKFIEHLNTDSRRYCKIHQFIK